MKLSIIVPAYNRARTIGMTLMSLVRQDLPADAYEIIVVDNNSKDATADVVRKVQTESPVLIRYHLERRQGVHYARNWAAVHARGDILYYTDDDMLADPGMLRELLKLFAMDETLGTASGRVLPKWEVSPPTWVLAFCQNGLLSLQLRPEELIISADDMGVYSCHQAIRRNVLLECGGFNPENTGGEWVGDGETGLCLRIRARGYKFGYTAKAITYHLIPPERMTQTYLNRRFMNQGYADTYTWFRAERPSPERLRREHLVAACRAAAEAVPMMLRRLLRRKGWRLRRAQMSYHNARSKYCARLQRDPAWREFVLKNNWIDETPALAVSPDEQLCR